MAAETQNPAQHRRKCSRTQPRPCAQKYYTARTSPQEVARKGEMLGTPGQTHRSTGRPNPSLRPRPNPSLRPRPNSSLHRRPNSSSVATASAPQQWLGMSDEWGRSAKLGPMPGNPNHGLGSNRRDQVLLMPSGAVKKTSIGGERIAGEVAMFIAGIKFGFHFWLATAASRIVSTGILSLLWIGIAACAVTVLLPVLIGEWASRQAFRLRVPVPSNPFRLQGVLWSKAPAEDELEGDGVIYTPPEILLHEFPAEALSPARECRETVETISA